MKALLNIITGGGKALASVKYILTLKGGSKEEQTGDLGARVGGFWKSDDLRGVEDDDFAALAKKIEAQTRLFCPKGGRHRDHLVLSSPAGESVEAFKLRVPQALEDLKKELQIKTYVAALHVDCEHPHLHIICDAYAPGVGRGQRRHCNRSKLRRLNENIWSKDFEAPTPSASGTPSERGQDVLNTKFKGWGEDKVDLCAEVFALLGGSLASVEDMVKTLEGVSCKRFACDFRDSSGEIKPSAVVVRGKVKARLSRILIQHVNLLKTKQFQAVLAKKDKEIEDFFEGEFVDFEAASADAVAVAPKSEAEVEKKVKVVKAPPRPVEKDYANAAEHIWAVSLWEKAMAPKKARKKLTEVQKLKKLQRELERDLKKTKSELKL